MFKVYFLSTFNLTFKISTFHLKVQTSHFSFPENFKEKISNAYAKVQNWSFDDQFPGNGFEFGIIGKDF